MSLLQDLVQELQQRIEGQAAAPSTAAVADAAGADGGVYACPATAMTSDERDASAAMREALRASSSAPKFDSNHRTNPLVFAARGAPTGSSCGLT